MATNFRQNMVTLKADGAVSKGMVCKAGSDKRHLAKSTSATATNIGIAQCDATDAGDPVELAISGGGAKGLAGAAISYGDLLTADGTGKLVATTTIGDKVVAQAMQDAVLNDLFDVQVSVSNY